MKYQVVIKKTYQSQTQFKKYEIKFQIVKKQSNIPFIKPLCCLLHRPLGKYSFWSVHQFTGGWSSASAEKSPLAVRGLIFVANSGTGFHELPQGAVKFARLNHLAGCCSHLSLHRSFAVNFYLIFGVLQYLAINSHKIVNNLLFKYKLM